MRTLLRHFMIYAFCLALIGCFGLVKGAAHVKTHYVNQQNAIERSTQP